MVPQFTWDDALLSEAQPTPRSVSTAYVARAPVYRIGLYVDAIRNPPNARHPPTQKKAHDGPDSRLAWVSPRLIGQLQAADKHL